jgi:hypothetical protein
MTEARTNWSGPLRVLQPGLGAVLDVLVDDDLAAEGCISRRCRYSKRR